MPPPARFVIEDEHLEGLADHSRVSSGDSVLLLINARAAMPAGRSGRRALVAVGVVTLVASIAVGMTLNHSRSAPAQRLEKPAPTADARAVVVGADQHEARDRGRADDRSR